MGKYEWKKSIPREFEAFQIGETERVVEQSESPFLLRVEFLDAEYVVLVMVRVGI